jgi:hypothetical protein
MNLRETYQMADKIATALNITMKQAYKILKKENKGAK